MGVKEKKGVLKSFYCTLQYFDVKDNKNEG